MTAITGDFGFRSACIFTQLTAVFFAARGNAVAGHMRAFLAWINCHDFLLLDSFSQ
jgi:hypothetical protein